MAPSGGVLALVSDKGGAGTSTAATNIATNLAREGRSVCLIDLVLPVGSVADFLNLAPAHSMAEIANSIRRREPFRVDELLAQHASGIRVLAEPLHGDALESIMPADMDEIFDRLTQSFDFLVVDVPKQFGDMQLLALDRAQIILFVTEMNVPTLRSARRTFDLYHRMGVDVGKIHVLLNRYITMQGMSLQAAESILGMRVFWTVPDDYRTVAAAVNRGLPLAVCDQGSAVAKSYAELPKALLQLLTWGES